ncbi:MAG: VapC toxin family PIN domain ribonuclease, partial [Candidatus Rokuibacteriota bacterium]
RGSAHHEQALALLAHLSEGTAPYALFWPSLYEFLRVVTFATRVFDPPSTTAEALEAIGDFLTSPSCEC